MTVSDIFAEPLAELRSRVTQYLPSKDMYTLTNRIIVANTFLLPTLSFHQRFFLMPPAALEAARATQVLGGEVPSPLNPPSGCVFHTRCPMAGPECKLAVPELREVRSGHFAACIKI